MSAQRDEARPLRLLVLYESLYPDYAGGIESRNFEMARALAERGHEVTLAGFGTARPESRPVLGFGDGAPLGAGRIERLVLGPPRGLYGPTGHRSHRRALEFAWRAQRIPLRNYDLIETASMPFLHLPGLALAARLARRPLLVVWHEVWGAYWKEYVGSLKAPIYRLLERGAARLGRHAVTISEHGRERLLRLRGERPGDEIALAPCGVDLDAIGRVLEEVRPEQAGPPLVVAGRLLAHKRIDLAIDALALLQKGEFASYGSPLLAIYGDGPERQRLEARASEHGVRDRVVFHGQVASMYEVWRGFAGARLVLHPSAREGFGLVPLEAMAARLPVVYCHSPESAVGELVRDGVEGRATEPSAAALADAIRELLTDESRRKGLAEAAFARAAAYSWRRLAGEYATILRQSALA